MRRSLAIAAVTVMLSIALVSMLDCSEGATTSTTIEGFFYNEIKDIGEATQVEISIYDWDGISEKSVLLGSYTDSLEPAKDASGKIITNVYKFDLTIEKTNIEKKNTYIHINIGGFSIASINGSLVPTPVNNLPVEIKGVQSKITAYRFLGSDTITDQIYRINTESTPITLKSATGTLTGKVMINSNEPVPLNGVKVSLYDLSTEKEIISTYTSNGTYTMTYSTGTYGIKYELDSYNTKTGTVTLTEGQINEIPDVLLQDNRSWLGTDLPHILMLLGGFFAVLLLIIISAYRLKIRNKV